MESKYRNNLPLHLQLEKNQRKYGYETSDLFVDTFVTIYGHKDEVNALDAARIIQAIIENPSDKLHYTMARNHFYKMHGTHSNSQSIRSSQESFTSTIDKPSQDLFNETTGQANGEKNNEKNNSVITMVNGSGFSRLELALHCLNRHSNFLCTNGVAVAKKHLMQLLTQICILLESNTISSTNSFLYLMLDKKLQDSYNLGYVVTLRLLSTYLLILFTVINSKKKNKKMRRLPFIISCDTQTFPDHYLVLSVPSLSTIDGEDGEYHGSTLCNMMTAAFTANATISPDLRCYFEFFDNSAFLIDKDQRQDFLNSLDDVLNE
ncbi:hypothetical protein SNEBB_011050 [Seison nebaliae]|nr:hypothetical protein SNEBB_011050 [Seison nebaliae]